MASATKLDYSFYNWHLVECKGAWGVAGLVGIVLLVLWLNRNREVGKNGLTPIPPPLMNVVRGEDLGLGTYGHWSPP